MDLTEVHVTCLLGWYPVDGFRISDVESSGFVTRKV
jgi:hypothetical protein